MSAGSLVLGGIVVGGEEASAVGLAALFAPEVVIPILAVVAIAALAMSASNVDDTAKSCDENAESIGESESSGGDEGGEGDGEEPKGKFASEEQLQDHFNRHGGDFGAETSEEYERQADEFLNEPKDEGTLGKTRPNGDIVRYNPETDEFGVAKADGTIRTYYKPDPEVHGYPSNLDYFNAQ